MTDAYKREIDYMRVSITDRCNLRCKYCMPDSLPFVPHEQILRNEEIVRICRAASGLGIKNIRVTGGEPLVRIGAVGLLRELKKLPLVEHVTMTTNAVLLEQYIDELSEIGLDGLNVSLNTLDASTYRELSGTDGLDAAWRSIQKALEAGLRVKLNCVPLRGYNDRELVRLAALAGEYPLDVRFIETMPIGRGQVFEPIANGGILESLRHVYPDLRENREKRGFGPARYYTSDSLQGNIGFISALTHGFCESCNRIRITSVGFLKLCLYYNGGVDLKSLIRNGADDGALSAAILQAIGTKPEKHLFSSGEQPDEPKKMWQIGG